MLIVHVSVPHPAATSHYTPAFKRALEPESERVNGADARALKDEAYLLTGVAFSRDALFVALICDMRQSLLCAMCGSQYHSFGARGSRLGSGAAPRERPKCDLLARYRNVKMDLLRISTII